MGGVLLVNEVGGGFGHLLPWRQVLAEVAPSVAWVGVSSNQAASSTFPALGPGVRSLRFPGTPLPSNVSASQLDSWPQVLCALGYADPACARKIFQGWHALFSEHAPALLVADHAPLAMLAAKALQVPVVEAGAGFCLPPAQHPMPPFLDRGFLAASACRAAEEALWSAWAGLPSGEDTKQPRSVLGDLFSGHPRWVCTFPELDPYGVRPDVEYLGPLPAWRGAASEANPATAWWLNGRDRVLAYLKLQTPDLGKVLAALQRSGRHVLAVVPGIGSDRVQGSMRVTGEIEELSQAIGSARLFITNGGAHGVNLAVAAGIPVLVIPMHVEQRLTGERLHRQGWGATWHPSKNPGDLHSSMKIDKDGVARSASSLQGQGLHVPSGLLRLANGPVAVTVRRPAPPTSPAPTPVRRAAAPAHPRRAP